MLFYAYFSVSKKRNIKRSRNGMKSTGEVIFGRKATQGTWSARQGINKESMRQGACPPPWARPPPSWAPQAPPTDFFRLYKTTYPKNIDNKDRSRVPPPQASVATKNLSGALPGTLPEGGSFTGGHLHHPGAIHDEEGVVHPRG